jgi:mannose-1-phosphate guanylyltransferase/mannose-6-phosphate isomerase
VINSIVPVILSGGSGTRLWPLSRKQFPKQYLPLAGENTMFQETILRLKGLKNLEEPIIICSKDHRFLVAEQLKQIGNINSLIILEPDGRNTAPAIAAAAIYSSKNMSKNSTLLVLPADHLIGDIVAFHDAINIGISQAKKEKLVTFGVLPTGPNTNYGYIKSDIGNNKFRKVIEFKEKPDKKMAQSYLDEGDYFWNSGIFIFQTKSILKELEKYAEEIFNIVTESVNNSIQDLDFIRLDEESFNSINSESIDYAVMEKSNNAIVIPLDVNWNDLGSWKALYDVGAKDVNGNVVNGDVITEDTSDCYIYGKHHMIATIGLKGITIVDTPNATLIANNNKIHNLNSLLDYLNKTDRSEQLYHRKVYRPWGWYDSIESGEHFQVKRLRVNPGAKLSLQLHHMRDEHWVVVKGTANATNGDQILTLHEGESTFIPKNVKHSLENLQKDILEIIEIQSGDYLGEDDIVRFEDIYGRS